MTTPQKKSGQMPTFKSRKFDFKCTQSGNCCRGEPGVVWVTQADISRSARHLGIDREEFYNLYVRVEGRRLTLREYANGDCVLWDKKVGCTIYPVRPKQCVTFPYWKEILEDNDYLREVAASCPGMTLKIPLT